jgi:hypothetical protein
MLALSTKTSDRKLITLRARPPFRKPDKSVFQSVLGAINQKFKTNRTLKSFLFAAYFAQNVTAFSFRLR